MEIQPLRYQNLNVLVVEDDESSYMLIEEFLSEYKLNLIRATNAAETLVLVNSSLQFSLAILDFKLPCKTDGIQLAYSIRAKRPTLGLIIQSAAYLTPSQKESIRRLSCDFIPKPLELSDFFKLVFKHIEHSLNITI